MRYDPAICDRRSIRLHGYDYSGAGAYFVTICTHERAMILADERLCQIVEAAWRALPSRFSTIALDEFVIMPNHVHGIVILTGLAGEGTASRAPTDRRPALGDVVLAFKSLSTIAVNRLLGCPGNRLWQRNYYEHIIRSEEALNRIREYILDNPLKWADDRDNPSNWSSRA